MRSWLLLGILVIVAALWLVPGAGFELQRLSSLVLTDLAHALPAPLSTWVWAIPPWFLLVLLGSGAAAAILLADRGPSRLR